jgi:NhaP-type Na+/H+ or K+/H+ antiporter
MFRDRVTKQDIIELSILAIMFIIVLSIPMISIGIILLGLILIIITRRLDRWVQEQQSASKEKMAE